MLDQYLWDVITSTGDRHGTIEVAPETGKRILQDAEDDFAVHPGKQRKILRSQVMRYAQRMSEGRWVDNAGGDLLFDRDGILRGGQHRVRALVEAGVTLSFKIRWDQGEDEIAADNEGGRPWNAADIAGGELKNRQLRQAIVTTLMTVDHENGLIGGQPPWSPFRLDVAEHCNDPRVIRAAEIGSQMRYTLPGLQGASIGAMYAMAANCNSGNGDKAPYFFETLRTGAGLFKGDPIMTLRNMLLGISFRDLSGGQKKWQTMYVTGRAWNYHIAGEKVEKMQRYTPPTNSPIRMAGWRPFFPKNVREQVSEALRELGAEAMVKR